MFGFLSFLLLPVSGQVHEGRGARQNLSLPFKIAIDPWLCNIGFTHDNITVKRMVDNNLNYSPTCRCATHANPSYVDVSDKFPSCVGNDSLHCNLGLNNANLTSVGNVKCRVYHPSFAWNVPLNVSGYHISGNVPWPCNIVLNNNITWKGNAYAMQSYQEIAHVYDFGWKHEAKHDNSVRDKKQGDCSKEESETNGQAARVSRPADYAGDVHPSSFGVAQDFFSFRITLEGWTEEALVVVEGCGA